MAVVKISLNVFLKSAKKKTVFKNKGQGEVKNKKYFELNIQHFPMAHRWIPNCSFTKKYIGGKWNYFSIYYIL